MAEAARIERAIRSLVGAGAVVFRTTSSAAVPPAALDAHSPITMYVKLRELYDQNGLYDDIAYYYASQQLYRESLQPLRNPANRVAEFYAAKLWPGSDLDEALPIVAEQNQESLKAAIHQIWYWSNWAAKKSLFARFLPIYGDQFVKVVGVGNETGNGRVYFQILEPETVTDVEADERGFLVYLRLDVPKVRRVNDKAESYTLTEVWERDVLTKTGNGRFRQWEHTKGERAELKDLGPPLRDNPITQFGISFIPVVQTMFRDVGSDRGVGAYTHAIGKMTEADRICTRLHGLIFRHSNHTWVATRGTGAGGAVLPPVRVEGLSSTSTVGGGEVEVGDERIVSMPGGSDLQSLVPNLPYGDLLAVLNAHMAELERDLPELAYFRLRELGGDLSGRAVRMLLTDAVDKILEARGNAEAGLVRLDMMGITVAQVLGLRGFDGLGKFADRALEHEFEPRDVIPTNSLEDAQSEQAGVTAKLAKVELGVSRQRVLKELGYADEEIVTMLAEREAEQAAAQEQFLTDFARGNVPVESRNGNGRGN